MLRALLLFITLTIGATAYAQDDPFSYEPLFKCEGDQERFNWYCEEKEAPEKSEPKTPIPEEAAPVAKAESQKEPELSEFESIQARLEELLQIAYVNPNEKNIYNYIEYQNQVSNKAAVFADTWKRVLWTNPQLDYSQKFPTARMAKAVRASMVRNDKQINLEHLKDQGYGLFFFYRSDCQYCHQMQYPVQILSERAGLDVMSISIDGVLLDKFPNSVANNGQAENLGVTQTPTIMLVNTATKQIQPIATGWTSLQELEKRIYVLTATQPGDNY